MGQMHVHTRTCMQAAGKKKNCRNAEVKKEKLVEKDVKAGENQDVVDKIEVIIY